MQTFADKGVVFDADTRLFPCIAMSGKHSMLVLARSLAVCEQRVIVAGDNGEKTRLLDGCTAKRRLRACKNQSAIVDAKCQAQLADAARCTCRRVDRTRALSGIAPAPRVDFVVVCG